jgi:hypothetical protein
MAEDQNLAQLLLRLQEIHKDFLSALDEIKVKVDRYNNQQASNLAAEVKAKEKEAIQNILDKISKEF